MIRMDSSSFSQLLLLLLLLALLSPLLLHGPVAAATTPVPPPIILNHNHPVVQFDHYVLALTWPNSYCKLQRSSPDPCLNPDPKDLQQFFTVHGFWPTFANRSSVLPSSCTATPFVLNKLNATVSVLANMYWPDIKMSKAQKVVPQLNEGFWRHEWESHGICSNLKQEDFMYLALTVYKRVQPMIKLAVKDQQKNGKKTVNIHDFQNDLTNLLKGVSPIMEPSQEPPRPISQGNTTSRGKVTSIQPPN